jgi:hypothetical protein
LVVDTGKLDDRIATVEAQIARLVDAVAKTGNVSLSDRIVELEREREEAPRLRAETRERDALRRSLQAVNPRGVEAILEFYPLMDEQPVASMRKVLASFVERITFDSTSRTVRVGYKVPLDKRGIAMASPRGFEPRLSP